MANLTQDWIWQYILKLRDEQAKTVQNRRLPVLGKLGMLQYLSFSIFCEHSLKSLLICCDAPQHYVPSMDV